MLRGTVALSDIGFGLGVREATVLEWRRRAAQKAHAINAHLWRDRPVPQGQLAAMWHCIRRQQAQPAGADGERRDLSADGRPGGWSSCAPEFRLILAACVGPRTLASALPLIQMTAAVVVGVPGLFSAGVSGYLSALLEVSHTLKTLPGPGQPGRPQPPVKEPHPDLVYGQVVKKQHQGRLQELVYRGRCGAKRFEALGLSSSPSVLERLHLTLRQALAPLGRKRGSVWKDRTQMRRRVVLLQACDNFARPQMSLRVPLSDPAPRALGLIQPKWRPQTPGMAAGLTEHGWTFRALLTTQCEPVHNQRSSE